jgi:acyl-CoA synthetase (AMP-forming)/AMP-acid ligase II
MPCPCFHIGGIATNLMYTLSSGGTVMMMAMFDLVDFCDILKNGRDGGESGSYYENENETETKMHVKHSNHALCHLRICQE